ncbi:MAG: helix-hairpin-helix domain-containing protein [Chitinophagaceae bacterium]
MIQQIETFAGNTDRTLEKEDLVKNLDIYLRHPLNVNTADEEDLRGLVFLNDEQIRNFMIYRKLFGFFINKYELQAIPGWDLATIEKIFPFVLIGSSGRGNTRLTDLFSKGDQTILYRMGRSLNTLPDFDPDSSGKAKFQGSRDHIYLRYKYNYQNRLEWQWLGDKDAGEQFFSGQNRYGFDFNSFHVSLKNAGIIKLLVVGDYTVTMAQGLIQWQGIALGKSADITSVKRSAQVIRPYTSSGETEFFRGVGVTLKRKNWEASFFLSRRAISAHIVIDSINDPGHITSILPGGYHRTGTERAQKNNVKQFSTGGAIVYNSKNTLFSINAITHHLSIPIEKDPLPYNIYAIKGSDFTNISVEFSRTIRNLHLFGEVAIDKRLHSCYLSGAMISLASNFDISFVGRVMNKAYQALYASAFSENDLPANERGFYTGISLRPATGVTLQAYTDFFFFPWLKYRVNSPSYGKEFAVLIKYLPDKKTELSCRFKSGNKPQNFDETTPISNVIGKTRQGLQLQGVFLINKSVTLKNRLESSLFKEPGSPSATGFLFFSDLSYKAVRAPWSVNLRMQYFEADSYDARIYAYENVMSYSFGFPAYYKKGFRGYLNYYMDLGGLIISNRSLTQKVGFWFRVASTYYPRAAGSGQGKTFFSEAQFQVLLSF